MIRRVCDAIRHRRQASGEAAFTLVELMISITILASIAGTIGLVFTVSLQNTDRIQARLPGPRAANNVSLYLSSDISSASPVTPDTWLNADPAADIGCADGPKDATNILRIETRSPLDASVTYVASYRYVAPTGDANKGELWRTFCVSGGVPSSNSMLADGIDPNEPPIATIAKDQSSVELTFLVWNRDSSPGLIGQCRAQTGGGLATTATARCPYQVKVSAAVRTVEKAPSLVLGTPTTLVPRQPCQFVKASISAPTRSGEDPSPLDTPVTVSIVTNESTGAICKGLVLKVPSNGNAECALAQKVSTSMWSGSCFGKDTGLLWPANPKTFPVFLYDRLDPGNPKAEPVELPVDIDVAGAGSLNLIVRTLIVPTAPTGVKVTPGNRSLIVSWGAPVLTPDTPSIDSYVVTAAPGGRTCATTVLTTCTLTGLTNGTTYSVTVTATNRVGTGPASTPVLGKPKAPLTIDGVVFEDLNYGGGSGRNRETSTAAGATGRPKVRVELFDVKDGVANWTDTTSTDDRGAYSFASPNCSLCAVRVVSASVLSSRAGGTTDVQGVLTFVTDASGKTVVDRTDMVGGTDPAQTDAPAASKGAVFNASTGVFTSGGKGTAQAFALVSDAIGKAVGVDFGFNFDTVTNTNDSGAGSLRQVVLNANALGSDTSLAQSGRRAAVENVVFMLPNGTDGAGLRSTANVFTTAAGAVKAATIRPTSALPAITAGLIVDAQTQPGWKSVPRVEIDGSGAGKVDGLTFTSAAVESVVRGLIVNRFGGGVALTMPAPGAVVAGNYLGTDAEGGAPAPNALGIVVSAQKATIGGLTVVDRNVVSGNSRGGIQVVDGATSTRIFGNYIGTNANGNAAVPNGAPGAATGGVWITGGAETTIGGASTEYRNVLSGNGGAGVWSGGGKGTQILGNYIGVNAAGTAALGNQRWGVVLDAAGSQVGGSTAGSGNVISGNAGNGAGGVYVAGSGQVIKGNTIGLNALRSAAIPNGDGGSTYASGIDVRSGGGQVIGGAGIGEGNVIAGNRGHGIRVQSDSAPGTQIRANSMYNNLWLGIDLGADGVTANDGVVSPGRANQLMDSPVFTRASLASSKLTVAGYVGTAPGQLPFAGALVDVFASDDDASGSGEGQTFLGVLTADGKAQFAGVFDLPTGLRITAGTTKLTATATDPNGNTSEFSVNIRVGKAPTDAYGVSGASMWVDASDTDGDGDPSNEPATNGKVLTLIDKSGSAHDFNSAAGSEPTLEVSTVFSQRALHFTRDQWMRQSANFGAPVTVIAVARPRVVPSGRLLQGVANNWLLGWWGNLERVAYHEGWVSYPGPASTTDGHVVTAVIRGSGLTSDFVVDGSVLASGTGGSTGPNGLGVNGGGAYGGEFSDLELAEIVVFPRALTVSDRALVESALSSKWGLNQARLLTAVSPVTQTGAANTAAASKPKVKVTDPYGSAVSGSAVTFTASAGSTVGGGRTAVVNTDGSGVAESPVWMLGPVGCADRVTVSAAGATSLAFTAQKSSCSTYGVTGASMWVDASDTDGDGNASNEPPTNGKVLTLVDKAGSDHDFNSTAGSEPTVEVSSVFSKRVLHFTANQWMRQPANFGSPVTVIAVARPRVVPSGRLLQGVANNWLLGWWANRERVGYFEGWVSYPGVPATTDGHVVSAVVRGAGLATDVAVDGATVATGPGGSSGPNGLGVNSGGAYGGESSDLELAEIVVFPRALTVPDRAMVESALARKWGVTFGKTMTARSSISQTGSANTVATSTPQVLVTDPYGAPMTGVSVTFTANAGSTVGGASSAVVNTDINGLATSPKWTLGLIGCTDRVVATAIAAPSVTFSADKPGCGTYGVSGVAMWVDASDTDGDGNAANEPALNSPVMTLTDKSGFGRNFVSQAGSQPTLESSTAFRRKVLHFTRSQWMRQTANFASPSTVIYVARSRTTSSNRVLQSVGNNWLLGWWNYAEGSAYFDGWVNMPASNSTTTNARIFSAVIRGPGQNTDVFADGASLASNARGTSGPNGLGINGGGAYPSEATDADVGEILVFPRALTVVERSQIETGLAMKWGISTPVTNGLVVSLDANIQSSMYQESTGTTPVSAAGQRVCRWSDLTPAANHAAQPTTAQCPTYGTDAAGGFVNFTANGSYTVSPILSPAATVLVVAQSNTANWNEYGWLASARGPNGFIIHPSAGNGSVQFYPVNSSGSYTYVGGATYSPITNPALYEFTMAGSSPVSGAYGRNGVMSAYSAAGVTRTAGPVRVVLGSDDYSGRLGNGRYREVLIYNRALSGDELTAVENYLRAKWGTG